MTDLVLPGQGPLVTPDPARTSHDADVDAHHARDHEATHAPGAADPLTDIVPMVRGRVLDNAGATISTTETIEKTATITIPGGWSTYDLDAFCGVRVFESGTLTADRNIDLFLRKDTVTGAILGLTTQQLGQNAPSTIEVTTFNGFLEGESATGARSIHFTAQLSGDTGQASWDDLRLIVYAYRLT